MYIFPPKISDDLFLVISSQFIILTALSCLNCTFHEKMYSVLYMYIVSNVGTVFPKYWGDVTVGRFPPQTWGTVLPSPSKSPPATERKRQRDRQLDRARER